MKKIISIIITLLMAVSMLTTFAFAETITGSCGGNVSFTIDTVTGTLVISGTGDMNDFEAHLGMSGTSWFSKTPFWNEYHSPVSDPEFKYDYTKYIKNVIIEEGVTSIGKYLFYGCDKIESITIPKSIKKNRSARVQ